jgi:hypothetical protein
VKLFIDRFSGNFLQSSDTKSYLIRPAATGRRAQSVTTIFGRDRRAVCRTSLDEAQQRDIGVRYPGVGVHYAYKR